MGNFLSMGDLWILGDLWIWGTDGREVIVSKMVLQEQTWNEISRHTQGMLMQNPQGEVKTCSEWTDHLAEFPDDWEDVSKQLKSL